MTTLIKNQKKFFRKDFVENGDPVVLIAQVRHDDECGNGHNTFSITGERYDRAFIPGESKITHKNGKVRYMGSCGCLHDDIAQHFPELAPLIKWHLSSTDGPTHYLANTLYYVDAHGPTHAWVYFRGQSDPLNIAGDTAEKLLGYEKAVDAVKAEGQPGYRVEWDQKNVKVANLDHARSSACWPEATDEDLTAPGLRERLESRLPAMMADFQTAVESLGFTF